MVNSKQFGNSLMGVPKQKQQNIKERQENGLIPCVLNMETAMIKTDTLLLTMYMNYTLKKKENG